MRLLENLFAFQTTAKDKSREERENEKRASFALPADDPSLITTAGSFGVQFFDANPYFSNEFQLITQYREMALHAETDAAISDVVDESLVMDSINPPVSINLEEVPLKAVIKEKIKKSFEEILILLNFRKQGYDIYKNWYVDGRLYYHVIVDTDDEKKGIIELKYIDPRQIRKVKEIEKTVDEKTGVPLFVTKNEFFVYNAEGIQVAQPKNGIEIDKDAIAFVHSGMFDQHHKMIISHLHKAIKPLNQVRMIEDAQVIYRISRAPERRIFYIDVGSLPKGKAEQYLQSMMAKYKNKLAYNPDTGEVRDKNRRYQTMLEDFWLPRREGSQGTEIQTLPAGQNLGEIEDIEYFLKKLYKALNVPVSRLEQNKGFSLGRSSEIQRDELKFTKFVNRLRTRFSHLFDTLLEKQLILKNIILPEEWETIGQTVRYEFQTDSQFTELKESEIWTERFNLLSAAQEAIDTGYVSRQWIKDNILRLAPEEQKTIDKEIKTESGEREEFPTPAERETQDAEKQPVDPDKINTDDFEGDNNNGS